MKTLPNTFLTSYILQGVLWAILLMLTPNCSWEEAKEGGFNTLKESQTQRCLDDPSRPPADCVNQPSYEIYQKEKEALP